MKFFIIKLLWLLPIPVLVAGVNFLIDPAKLYQQGGYEYDVAQLLLKGNNVANASNFDERLLWRDYIEGLEQRKRTVVFGSSRSMQIGTETFCDDSFINNSVSGASLEDYMAMYNIYRREDLIPSGIILGLDPWILNKYKDQFRWETLRPDYEHLRGILLSSNTRINDGQYLAIVPEKYYQLLSPSYFQVSVKAALGRFLVKSTSSDQKPVPVGEFYVTDEPWPDEGMIRADGRHIYRLETRLRDVSEVRSGEQHAIAGDGFYSLNRFYTIDVDFQTNFELFIGLLLQDGVNVTFFLPPYSPMVYDYLLHSNEYQIIESVESYFRLFAESNNIALVGSYNSKALNLSYEHFIDYQHPKPEAISMIFSNGCSEE